MLTDSTSVVSLWGIMSIIEHLFKYAPFDNRVTALPHGVADLIELLDKK